jgi:hypothetical protein
MQYEL